MNKKERIMTCMVLMDQRQLQPKLNSLMLIPFSKHFSLPTGLTIKMTVHFSKRTFNQEELNSSSKNKKIQMKIKRKRIYLLLGISLRK